MIVLMILVMLAIFTPIAIGVGVPLLTGLSLPYVIMMLLESLGIDGSSLAFFTPAFWNGVVLDTLRNLLGF